MSLRDTIEAARREAEEAGSVFVGKDKSKDEGKDKKEETTTYSRRSSAASAKPATSAASSVRVISAEDARYGRTGKKSSEMSKEERKAERSRVRDVEDRQNMAANILLKRDRAYNMTQKVWWICLGSGLALTVISFGINWWLNREGTVVNPDLASKLVVVALVSLVLAYVLIIGAFIYDLMKARPIRKRVDAEVKGMTKRRIDALLREDAEEKAAKAKK
ncbi:MAG: hypothetical protein Q4D48_08970 [Coriobacteriales bacterium]|jgi:hypothetical protein|nr:hypothetical protein [Coriobacteriales bacterium]